MLFHYETRRGFDAWLKPGNNENANQAKRAPFRFITFLSTG